MEATVDKFGRIVIPKRVRDDLGIKAGTVVLLEEKGAGGHPEAPACRA